METEYIVMDRAAKMPGNCWGQYRRVAVVEVEAGVKPKMISERARGVVRVVQTWEKQHVGTTERCAFRRALIEARELAAELRALKLELPDAALAKMQEMVDAPAEPSARLRAAAKRAW